MQGRTVLVTGRASFIASHVVEAVSAKARPSSSTTTSGSGITSPSSIRGIILESESSKATYATFEQFGRAVRGADAVIHLAAFLTSMVVRQPKEGVEVNVRGACQVLQAAAKAGVRQIVLGSSVSVYGCVDGQVDADRGSTFEPLHWGAALYGTGKVVAEQIGRMVAERSGASVIALR